MKTYFIGPIVLGPSIDRSSGKRPHLYLSSCLRLYTLLNEKAGEGEKRRLHWNAKNMRRPACFCLFVLTKIFVVLHWVRTQHEKRKISTSDHKEMSGQEKMNLF